jgi:glucose-6-phosphate isomerase
MTPATRTVLAELKSHAREGLPDMRKAFAAGKKGGDRFAAFSARQDDLLLDYSKCRVTDKTMKLLTALAKAADVEGQVHRMMRGDIINTTEQRAVLHTALRRPKSELVFVGGHNIVHDVHDVLEAMARFAVDVRQKHVAGKITDVVNIGIGGSDLGPVMATLALAPYHDGPRAHFVSNVDGAHIADTLKGLNPETTLFLVASKTFTTIETMTNARTARGWLVERWARLPWASISPPSPPHSTRSRPSASRRTAPSASGTGWAGAIRCGRPSACR